MYRFNTYTMTIINAIYLIYAVFLFTKIKQVIIIRQDKMLKKRLVGQKNKLA
jgi:hypothetical protein